MKLFKLFILRCLMRAVRRFFHTNPHTKLVVVVGSIGKTSTKSAISHLLSDQFIVRTNRGNFNATLSAPLEILGVDGPKNPRNPLQWLQVVRQAQKTARQKQKTEIIIQECGTDRPGDIPQFASYLRPHITVVTAISPEHMEFFGNLDAVAREELSISEVSQTTVYNRDDIDDSYTSLITSPARRSYGDTKHSDVSIQAGKFQFGRGFSCRLRAGKNISQPVIIPVLGAHQLRVLAGAAAVALELGMTIDDISQKLSQITPVEGRMQLLVGARDTTLIDDSYNASPLATIAALDTLYQLPHVHKIAVLGGMNELGDETADAHQQVAAQCDPTRLDLVVTVGKLAAEYLAPAARQNGCRVVEYATTPEAAEFLRTKLGSDTAMLFKGSQGGIFLEEAIKPLLKNSDDSQKLVRQSDAWLAKKRAFFTSQQSKLKN